MQVYPLFFSGHARQGRCKERWQWTFPIVFSPVDPNMLYTSLAALVEDDDDGQNWEQISPDLTRADPEDAGRFGRADHAATRTVPRSTARSSRSRRRRKTSNTIWTGSDDGFVQITRDGGKTWTNVTPPGMPDFGARQPDRRLAAQRRHGVRGGEELSARRSRAVHLSGPTTTARPGRRSSAAFAPAISCTRCAKTPKRAGLLYARDRARHLRVVRRWRARGSRCG